VQTVQQQQTVSQQQQEQQTQQWEAEPFDPYFFIKHLPALTGVLLLHFVTVLSEKKTPIFTKMLFSGTKSKN
jgi:hypothetical protein